MIKNARRGKWRVRHSCLYDKLVHYWDIFMDGEYYRVGEFSLSLNASFMEDSGNLRLFSKAISHMDSELASLLQEVIDGQRTEEG